MPSTLPPRASASPADAHPPPWGAGQPYSVKRHGVTVDNCDREPVQTPGCVQGHGALLVLRASDLVVVQASENAEHVLGHAAAGLIGHPVAAAIGDAHAKTLAALVAREPIDRNPLYVATLEPGGGLAPLDITAHTTNGALVLEFEATGRSAVPAPDYYGLVKKTVARMQTSQSLLGFCQTVADEVRSITGLDRVMIYKFHADGHGEVYAESRRDELPPWLGLHYPAEDIPVPAREVFKQVWIRPIPDIDAPLAELVPLVDPAHGEPLVMTHCALRGPSVMYTEYLRNMRVTAGLTMSIRRQDELWGLIACHHYAGPVHLPYQVRAACEFIAQVMSLQHKAAEEREQFQYRLTLEAVHQQVLSQAAQEGGLSAMTDGSPTLLDGIDAGGAALYHRDRWWRVGATPSDAQLDELGTWLESRPEFGLSPPLLVTDSLAALHPPAAAYADVASGLMAVPLTRSRRNVMLWFKPETTQTVNWGGNPYDKPTVPGPHGPRLTPRRSFELFVESVKQRSLPWKPVEVDAVQRLRLLVMELVVSRADHLANLNADLAQSNDELDAFAYVASHDLKEPLRGIHKYAHQLLEGEVVKQPEDRRKMESLMRLTLRMDSLLDSLLHFSQVGRVTLEMEPVDLDEVLAEAIEMVDARRSEVPTRIEAPRGLPSVNCDRMRVREVLVNLLSNAMKYNRSAERRIEVGFTAPDEVRDRTAWPPAAAGRTVFHVRDNGIGIAPQHADQVFRMFKRLHGRDEYGGGAGAGLPIVRKLIERHGGTIWLDSAPAAGTTFFFTLEPEATD